VIHKISQLANDSFHLLQTPYAFGKKAALWSNLIRRSGRFQSFDVSYLDRASYAILYREIFVRSHYCFSCGIDSPVIFDCGANIGMATLYFKWLYPQARIHCFEPDPTTFGVLQKNISANRLSNVVAHNCALWSEDATIPFFVDPSVKGSLRMASDASRLTNASEISVPARLLSAFIHEPTDFLKLDVEGAEHKVVCDLAESGRINNVRQMAIEYHHSPGEEPSRLGAFLATLESVGFDYQIIATFRPLTAQGQQQDILIRAYRRTDVP
jgi:FkbM family methyltransferase